MTTALAPAASQGVAPIAGSCDLAVIILTLNEARHIARAIESVRGIARAVVVVDSHSTDDTVAIARAAGATVLENRFVNHSKQFQWALDNCGVDAAWIMRLDADEVIEPDLAAAIATRLPALPADVAGVNFDRKHIFMGRWIRHGGRYPVTLLRVWRRGQGRIEDRWMDEHMIVWGGRTVAFKGGFSDINENDLSFFTDKHNKYATHEAIDRLNHRFGLFPNDRALSTASASFQATLKRRIKEKFYNRLPVGAGPLGYFLYRYFLQLGFLDGTPGLIYHFLQGYWYRFLVEAKVVELSRGIADCTTNDDRIARLRTLTGLKL